MLLSAVSIIVYPSYEIKKNYLYVQILRLLFFLSVSNYALKKYERKPNQRVDINEIV